MLSCIFGDPCQLYQFVYLEVPLNNVQVQYPFIPYEVCGRQFEKPKHLFRKSSNFSLIFCASTYGTLVFPLLREGWK